MPTPPRRYNLLSILREARRGHTGWGPAWRKAAPQAAYDVAIVGGGAAALALAYELARGHGAARIAVLAPGPLGGAPGTGSAVLRYDRREPAAIALFVDARRRYERLGAELDFNLGFAVHGLLNLAFSEIELDRLSCVAALGAHAGNTLWMVPPREARSLLPVLAADGDLPAPLAGALWQPSAALIEADAVVWGYARMAAAHGADIVEDCHVSTIEMAGGRAVGVRTAAGFVGAGSVVLAGAETEALLPGAGVALPLVLGARAVMTTAPARPLLDRTVGTSFLGGLVHQNRQGRLVLTLDRPEAAPWTVAGDAAARLLALAPALGHLRLARAERVVAVTTPDGAPILGPLGPDGLWACFGWGGDEVAAAPAAGARLADSIANGWPQPAIVPFGADRFLTGALLDERPALAPA
jgi:sarcosine oxidase subunit beta